MKLSEWARKSGVQYKTAWRMYHDGKLPVNATQWATGTIWVDETQPPVAPKIQKTAIYARVSSSDQAKDLDRQVARLATYAIQKGLSINEIVTEIGSGMNGNRHKLTKLLSNPEIDTILVEHQDRLARFGFSFIEAALKAANRRIIVTDVNEIENDLVKDMIEVMTSFCARLYGKRGAKNRASRAVAAAEKTCESEILDEITEEEVIS